MIKRLCIVLSVLTLVGCGGRPSTQTDEGQIELAKLTPKKRTQVRHSLIDTLISNKAYDSAVPLINQALREAPKDARLHMYRATVLRARGRLEQARAVYETSLKFEPKLAQAHAGLGIVLNMLGQHESATEAHQRATMIAKGYGPWLNNLGFSLYLEKKYDKAIAAYEAAIQADSRSPMTFVNLGFAFAAKDQIEKAKRAFTQVLSEAETLNNLALAKELKGDADAARQLYEQALLTDPKNTEAASNLDSLNTDPVISKESK